MRRALVDTNVLIDVASEDPKWFDWSATQLGQAIGGIASVAGAAPRRCPTSSSARTRRWKISRCSRAMAGGIGNTFPG
jgi:predicted nucleic acid-binding protein